MSRSPDPAVRQRWQKRLERQQRSELSVTEFCRREGVSAASFYQWRKRLGSHASAPPAPNAAEPKFVPLLVTGSAAAAAKLQLPGGAAIELPASLKREQLTELLAACIAATNETLDAEVPR